VVPLVHILHMFVLQEETELYWPQRYTYNRLYSGTVQIFCCIEFFFQVLKILGCIMIVNSVVFFIP